MENMDCYEKMLDMLTENMGKMSEAFKDAYDAEPVAHRRLDICKDYAQAVSGLGLVMNAVGLMRPKEVFNGFMALGKAPDPQ